MEICHNITIFTFAGLITPPCMLVVGKLLDMGYNRRIMHTGLSLVLAAWLVISFTPQWLWLFIFAALLLDPCSSAVTVSVQQKILANAPLDVGGRLNSLNISLNFFDALQEASWAHGYWLITACLR